MNFKTNGFQSSVNENKNELTLEDYKKMFTPSSKLKREVSLFSAITLPLVLAACGGGGGGGGAVSPTPDSGGDSSSGGSTGGDSGSGSSTDDRLQLNNKSVAATDGADVFVYDVSFDNGSVIGLDGNATITGFDPATDSIVFRAPSSVPAGFNSSALVSSTGIDIVSSVIDGNTVIYLSPDSNGASSTLTIEGVNDGDLSEIQISAEEGEADATVAGGDASTDAVDLSSGTVDATSGNDVYEYTIKFVDGAPVAIDGNITINDFNTSYDKLILKAESVPSGYSKTSLLSTANVDIVSSSFDNTTTIFFAPDDNGSSSSITFNGINDEDLSSIGIEIQSGSVTATTTIDLSTGTNVELGTDDVTASSDAENFIFDATYADSTFVGNDGPLTITGFDQANDRIVILAADTPVGYSEGQFIKATGIDVVQETFENSTTIYFAPDANGSSTSLTLAGITDGDLLQTVVVPISTLDAVVTSTTDSSSSESSSSESSSSESSSSESSSSESSSSESSSSESSSSESSSSESSSSESSSSESSTSSVNIIEIALDAAGEIAATDAADEFRYEFEVDGNSPLSKEGNFDIKITGFDADNDKIVLVNVGGTDLTLDEFKALDGEDISQASFDNTTTIFFAPNASGSSGSLTIDGFADAEFATITLQILADSSLPATSDVSVDA